MSYWLLDSVKRVIIGAHERKAWTRWYLCWPSGTNTRSITPTEVWHQRTHLLTKQSRVSYAQEVWTQEGCPYSHNLFQNPFLLCLILSFLFLYLLLCPALHPLTHGFLIQLSTSSAHQTLTCLSSLGVTSLKPKTPNDTSVTPGNNLSPTSRHVHTYTCNTHTCSLSHRGSNWGIQAPSVLLFFLV